jgi:DNA-binding NarL/FixJ family response regulator
MTPKPRVLLADDYPSLLTALGRMLSVECEIAGSVSTAAELLEAARNCAADIAIVDLSLPDASGIDVCRQLKVLHPALSIIILTAMDQADFRAAALEAGAADFVSKGQLHVRLLPAIHDIWSKKKWSR